MKWYGLVIILLCLSCNNKENDLTKDNLKGKVKKITTSYYNAIEKFGDLELQELEWILGQHYNTAGNIMEENRYNGDGELNTKIKYTYDENSNRMEQNRYNGDGILERKYKYTYDENSNLIESNYYDEDGELYTKVKDTYDENSNLIKEEYFSDDELYRTTEHYYNKNNQLIKNIEIEKNGGRREYFYDYNDKGDEIKYNFKVFFLEENEGSVYCSYEYDEFKNWIKKDEIDEEWDFKNNEIEKTFKITLRKIEYY